MTNRTDYNGWTNRETWLVNLHFEPKNQNELRWIKGDLEDSIYRIEHLHYGRFFSDFIDLGKINWDELEQHVQENYEEE